MYNLTKKFTENPKTMFSELLIQLFYAIFILHGFAHLVGTVAFWKIQENTTNEVVQTSLFLSKAQIEGPLATLFGGIYLLLALAFIIGGFLLLMGKISFDNNIILIIVLSSLVMTFINLMPTIIGLLINIFYVIAILGDKKFKLTFLR